MDLKGKKGVVIGVANTRSIAYGCCEQLKHSGAEIALGVLPMMMPRVEKYVNNIGIEHIFEYDAMDQSSLDAFVTSVVKVFGKIDFIVHSIAFTDKDNLSGYTFDITKESFEQSSIISAFSLVEISKAFYNHMNENGSILCFTYIGSELYVPNYNIMGVCKAMLEASTKLLARDFKEKNISVNAVSPGPIRTLASAAIGDFPLVMKWANANTMIDQELGLEDIGNVCVFLISSLSQLTGQNVYIDCGVRKVIMVNRRKMRDSHSVLSYLIQKEDANSAQ